MDAIDLIGIGRLGGRDDHGYYHAMIKPDFKPVFSALTECYLIFNSDRVFYVTISDKKIVDKKLRIRFVEDGIDEERPLHKEVTIAIDSASTSDDEPEAEELELILGYRVLFQDAPVGILEDYFYNGAHYVLQITDEAGGEVLVPWVPYFINATIHETGTLILQNAEGLILP